MAQLTGITAAVVTVSDSVCARSSEDISGPAVVEILKSAGATVTETAVISDEFVEIIEALKRLSDCDLIVTTGGTGFSPRDNTPEATTSVCQRLAPGLAEFMRAEGLKKTPFAALSRAVAGIRGSCLIVNVPGSPTGATESLNAILPALAHGLRVLKGEIAKH